MEITYQQEALVALRIRFAGSAAADNYHLTAAEGSRFYADWETYLKGGSVLGGTYTVSEAEKPILISLNFSVIAYIENGKVY
ncbi:hypothetical protein [Armatimonas rosea]|uniref:Uncharacterized protein n=1 Tax=Armatimonas rosea TaxID=685828 RepID=A0A7W9SQ67_ARMRO|nr:hypothetical protein [Armatimonas rosea]MBB6050801.1 hypothetical protein [Armatimonas rosea]